MKYDTLKDVWNWAVSGPWIERDEDTEYKYNMEDGVFYLTFQGSGSEIDWKQNFDFWAKPYRNMEIPWMAHRGFIQKWKVVEDEILSIIKSNKITKIRVTGFSQGASLATLAHESFWYHFPELRKEIHSIVFGSPRVIWFWNRYKIKERWENLLRVTMPWDLVTDVPFTWTGYLHIGDNLLLKPPFWWIPKFNVYKSHLSYPKYL